MTNNNKISLGVVSGLITIGFILFQIKSCNDRNKTERQDDLRLSVTPPSPQTPVVVPVPATEPISYVYRDPITGDAIQADIGPTAAHRSPIPTAERIDNLGPKKFRGITGMDYMGVSRNSPTIAKLQTAKKRHWYALDTTNLRVIEPDKQFEMCDWVGLRTAPDVQLFWKGPVVIDMKYADETFRTVKIDDAKQGFARDLIDKKWGDLKSFTLEGGKDVVAMRFGREIPSTNDGPTTDIALEFGFAAEPGS